MLVFSSVRMGVNPEINALASLILLVVGILGLIAWWFMARSENNDRVNYSGRPVAES